MSLALTVSVDVSARTWTRRTCSCTCDASYVQLHTGNTLIWLLSEQPVQVCCLCGPFRISSRSLSLCNLLNLPQSVHNGSKGVFNRTRTEDGRTQLDGRLTQQQEILKFGVCVWSNWDHQLVLRLQLTNLMRRTIPNELSGMRFFIHSDPKHRVEEAGRPAGKVRG